MNAKQGNLSINSENIFPIIKKWLYSDHDIFVRELVSNGCDAITKLKSYGCTKIRMLCLVAAPEGVARLQQAHPEVDIYTASLDQALNPQAYILPGLGDAGDRFFGTDET